ncbi:MAG: hypothetical protein S4CHLAM2_16460 [Chlamydiales bacterium]|nr:hypothetical protein [Chlamydiales bacterium]
MKIVISVICAHFLVLAGMTYFHPPKAKPLPRKAVAVQTYLIQEEKPKPQIPPSTPKSKPAPAPKPAPKPKPKPKPVTKPKPTVTQTPKKKPDPQKEELVRMMQKSLSSLDQPSKPTSTPTKTTKPIGPLASEALHFEAAYQDRLIAFLENALTLPEKGNVKLALTVNRSGMITQVHIKEAASSRNRSYIETSLPELLLPPFTDQFKGESTHTFSITLTSS